MERSDSVATVLAALWRRARVEAVPPEAEPLPDERAETRQAAVRTLSRLFGERAMDCVSATIQGDRAALVRHSAELFERLFALWAETGVDPREVWIELHKREQLGTLLMQLNQAQNQLPRRVLKPWRVDSTKLP